MNNLIRKKLVIYLVVPVLFFIFVIFSCNPPVYKSLITTKDPCMKEFLIWHANWKIEYEWKDLEETALQDSLWNYLILLQYHTKKDPCIPHAYCAQHEYGTRKQIYEKLRRSIAQPVQIYELPTPPKRQ